MKPVICTKVFSCSACLKIYHDNLGCDCAIGAAKPAELIEMRLVGMDFMGGVPCGYQSKLSNSIWVTCSKDFYDEVLADPELWREYSVRPVFTTEPTLPKPNWVSAGIDLDDENTEKTVVAKIETVKSTPSAQWRVKGEKDPHAEHYNCDRAKLTLGQYTDDALANGAFLNYDRPLDAKRLIEGDRNYHAPIAWMTAVKERIRWLSRSLEKALCDLAAAHRDTDSAMDAAAKYSEDYESAMHTVSQHELTIEKLEADYRKAIDTLSMYKQDDGLADND